jgi:hypothetical protein
MAQSTFAQVRQSGIADQRALQISRAAIPVSLDRVRAPATESRGTNLRCAGITRSDERRSRIVMTHTGETGEQRLIRPLFEGPRYRR